MQKLKPWQLKGREYVRGKVRARDNFTCQECGKKHKEGERAFDVHHLNGMCGKKSTGYDSIKDMDGLITVCHKCHFNRHDWAGVGGAQLDEGILKKTLELRSQGKTQEEIAKEFGVTRQAISLRLLNYEKRKLST